MAMILHIETATDICSVSLARNGRIVDIREKSEDRSHASTLTVFISEILEKNNLSSDELNAVAVSMGPGSYTGLRIGVSVAKGICYGAGIPLIAVPTLEAMYIGMREKLQNAKVKIDPKTVFAPMLDARRMEVYVSLFGIDGKIVEETSALIVGTETFNSYLTENKVYFFGAGSKKLTNTIVNNNAIFVDDFNISSAFMIPIACERFENKVFEDLAYFEPFYLKDFIATTPKRRL
jgi:tRNA threonylcarbamoyladenosine biosynthesis protein TsaB